MAAFLIKTLSRKKKEKVVVDLLAYQLKKRQVKRK
jgi:hypothetical protein